MKYSIEGFSQVKLVEHGLDCTDATLLRWYIDFQATGKMKCVDVDSVRYTWISYAYAIEQLPILGIQNPEIIGRRLRKMADAGVLRFHIKRLGKGKGTVTYWAMGDNYADLIQTTPVDEAKQAPTPDVPIDTDDSKVVSNDVTDDRKVECNSSIRKNSSIREERGTYYVDPTSRPNTTDTDSPPSFSKPEEQEEYRIRKLIRENHLKCDAPLVKKMTQFKNAYGIEPLERLIFQYLRDGKKPTFFYQDFITYLYTYEPPEPEPKIIERSGPSWQQCAREEQETLTPEQQEEVKRCFEELRNRNRKELRQPEKPDIEERRKELQHQAEILQTQEGAA